MKGRRCRRNVVVIVIILGTAGGQSAEERRGHCWTMTGDKHRLLQGREAARAAAHRLARRVWARTRLMQVSKVVSTRGRGGSQGAKFGGQRAWAGVDHHSPTGRLNQRVLLTGFGETGGQLLPSSPPVPLAKGLAEQLCSVSILSSSFSYTIQPDPEGETPFE